MKRIILGKGKLGMLEAFHIALKGISFHEKHGGVSKFETFFHPEEGFVLLTYDSVWKDGNVVHNTVRVNADGTLTIKEETA